MLASAPSIATPPPRGRIWWSLLSRGEAEAEGEEGGKVAAVARRQGRGVVIECVPEQTVTRHIAEKSGFRFCGMAEGCCVYRRQPDEKEPL